MQFEPCRQRASKRCLDDRSSLSLCLPPPFITDKHARHHEHGWLGAREVLASAARLVDVAEVHVGRLPARHRAVCERHQPFRDRHQAVDRAAGLDHVEHDEDASDDDQRPTDEPEDRQSTRFSSYTKRGWLLRPPPLSRSRLTGRIPGRSGSPPSSRCPRSSFAAVEQGDRAVGW